MTRNVTLYIKDLLESMENAEAFAGNMSYEDFSGDMKTSYAIVRCIEIIGEASKNIPHNIRRKYPGIPWKKMAGMRDKVIHFYFGVNFRSVWLVVKNEIPSLKPQLKKILEDLEKEIHD